MLAAKQLGHQACWGRSVHNGAAPRPSTVHRQRAGRRAVRGIIRCDAQSTEMLAKAKELYQAKDLMSAMRVYEDVLKRPVTAQQKQAAIFGQTAVHAAFGDIELAQITLREGIREGLDFEAALNDPDLPKIISSVQLMIQLRRFNQNAQKAQAGQSRSKAAVPAASSSSTPSAAASSSYASSSGRPMQRSSGGSSRGGFGRSMLDEDPLGSIMGSATSDQAQVDTSPLAVVRRVLLLLLALIGLGVGLFFLGLETAFPQQ